MAENLSSWWYSFITKSCYFPSYIASQWFYYTLQLLHIKNRIQVQKETLCPPHISEQYYYCLCWLSWLLHLSPSPLVTFHSNSCWLAKAVINWGSWAAKFSQQFWLCHESPLMKKVLPPPTSGNSMNHFPPLSLSGVNAISVQHWFSDSRKSWMKQSMETGIPMWNQFVRNTPLFWPLSDCHLDDNHTYVHEKCQIFLLPHSPVLLGYIFCTARYQCIFTCSIWELHCMTGTWELSCRTLGWISWCKWVEESYLIAHLCFFDEQK